MRDQHQKISGYRELDQIEIDAMNELKALEKKMLDYLVELANASSPPSPARADRYHHDGRWLSIARTHIQQGVMAACRAVARPNDE